MKRLVKSLKRPRRLSRGIRFADGSEIYDAPNGATVIVEARGRYRAKRLKQSAR